MRRIILSLVLALLTFTIGVAIALSPHFWKKQNAAKVVDVQSGQILHDASVYVSNDGLVLIDPGQVDLFNQRYLFSRSNEWGASIGTLYENRTHTIKLPGYIYIYELLPDSYPLDGVKRVDGQ